MQITEQTGAVATSAAANQPENRSDMGVAIDRRIASPWSEVSWLSAAQTRWVVARLLELGGVFFAVTPLPGDRFAIGVKPEWENTLLDIVRAETGALARRAERWAFETPGKVLPNGAIIVVADLVGTGRNAMVLAITPEGAHPYATWIVNRDTGLATSGDYFLEFEEAVRSFNQRSGKEPF